MATGCTITSKICLIAISLVFWGAAAGLIFVGGWVFETYKHYNELTTANLTLIPAAIIVAVGVLMFIIGLLGCVSSAKENKCLLATFFSLLLCILVAEMAAGALGYAFRDDMESAVKDGMTQAVNRFNGTHQDHQMDYVQRELHCCGVKNASDWFSTNTVWAKTHDGVPESCCINRNNCTDKRPNSKQIYKNGCLDLLNHKFMSNLGYIAGVAVAFAVIQKFRNLKSNLRGTRFCDDDELKAATEAWFEDQTEDFYFKGIDSLKEKWAKCIKILGMICSCVLFCRSREVRYEVLGGPNSGLRV